MIDHGLSSSVYLQAGGINSRRAKRFVLLVNGWFLQRANFFLDDDGEAKLYRFILRAEPVKYKEKLGAGFASARIFR